jgi:hypothetical protein
MSDLIAGRLRRDGYRSPERRPAWGITPRSSRFDRVMLVEQTPVGRGYRSGERWVTG